MSGRVGSGTRVWWLTMSLSHFAVLLKSTFAFATARTVRADTHLEREGAHIFLREGEEVFRVPACYVHTVSGYSSQMEASERVREFREARAGAGAASAHITEGGVAPRTHPQATRQGSAGAVAEALSVRVKE